MTLQSEVLFCDFSSFSIGNKSVTITNISFFILSNDAVLLGLLQVLYIMSVLVKP